MDERESRNRRSDRGNNRDSCRGNRGTESNMIQERAAPRGEARFQGIGFGYPQ